MTAKNKAYVPYVFYVLRRNIMVGSKDCLTSKDHKISGAGDGPGGTQNMFKLLACHGLPPYKYASVPWVSGCRKTDCFGAAVAHFHLPKEESLESRTSLSLESRTIHQLRIAGRREPSACRPSGLFQILAVADPCRSGSQSRE